MKKSNNFIVAICIIIISIFIIGGFAYNKFYKKQLEKTVDVINKNSYTAMIIITNELNLTCNPDKNIKDLQNDYTERNDVIVKQINLLNKLPKIFYRQQYKDLLEAYKVYYSTYLITGGLDNLDIDEANKLLDKIKITTDTTIRLKRELN